MRFFKLGVIFIALIMVLTACTQSVKPENSYSVDVTSLTGGNVSDVVLEKGDEYAVISIRDFGDITVKLLPECAPVAVENFISLAQSGYYEGKVFHRIIEDFMIQGGSPTGDGTSDINEDTFAVERAYNARHFYGALSMANAMGQNSQQFYIVNNKKSVDPQSGYTAEELTDVIEQYTEYIDQYSSEMSDDELTYYTSYLNIYLGMLDFLENLTDEIIEKYKDGGGVNYLDGGYTVFGHTVDGFDVIDAISAVEVEDNGNDEESKPVEEIVIEKVTIHTYEG